MVRTGAAAPGKRSQRFFGAPLVALFFAFLKGDKAFLKGDKAL
jgi:hypothetical protein